MYRTDFSRRLLIDSACVSTQDSCFLCPSECHGSRKELNGKSVCYRSSHAPFFLLSLLLSLFHFRCLSLPSSHFEDPDSSKCLFGCSALSSVMEVVEGVVDVL